ncbi:putative trifunctional 2-polyprenylphenol hydroxylase domain-containing protein [Andreesenia angusta]|uniref:Putative trifunctional 2-polyprenylphenol hydroxylase domain-containing protein n=1 Tax=Andreesenia angusta TaxID=39480 RepID=A0A1S1VAB2_9FIRM|nr:ferritin family protein [Andreesenia angusta]OHW62659.1 putative trifunctional 2-polyprenylphenol hydroxylase domain-containing protein [Andreesenia angusta]
MKEVIKFAIQNEIEAYNFYEDAAKKIEDKQLKETFEDLAREEHKHREFLEDFLAEGLEKMHFKPVEDYKIAESVDEVHLSTDMKFVDAIALAMKKEEEAMAMYQKLSEISTDESQKELFDGLADMEKMHKVRLEEIYTNAAFVEVW